VGTVIDYKQRDHVGRHQRWDRIRRAALLEQYGALQAQGLSQRQAAKTLDVPRTTLQAWRGWQDRLDACPYVVEFFESVPGLAFLHRLVLAFLAVCVEIGACGIRLVCLWLEMTGLNRFVGASFGTQQHINRAVEEAIVAYAREETHRLAQGIPPQDITVTQDETFTGGLCLVAMEPVSNYILLEQPAEARDHDTWSARMQEALAPLKCNIIQSTSEVAYLGAADNVSRLLPSHLSEVNQPIIRSRDPLSRPHPAHLTCLCAHLSRSTPRSSTGTIASTVCGCGHGGTRNISTSRKLQT
jgi:hypothetical protein